MNWLIVEDALRDKKGHWSEYIATFSRGLADEGDNVVILCDRKADPDIVRSLDALPILPESIWHRMGDGASSLTRYMRVPLHAFNTYFSIRRFFRSCSKKATSLGSGNHQFDIIFVPTALVHHLLGWYFIVIFLGLPGKTKVLLFFPNLPFVSDEHGNNKWAKSPTTWLMRGLFRLLKPLVCKGSVILGVETEQMRMAFCKLTGLHATYFPHPVSPVLDAPPAPQPGLLFAGYGAARAEKGSDIFQSAIEKYICDHPDGKLRFAIQWNDGFTGYNGKPRSISPLLTNSKKVEYIERYFGDGEYIERLQKTHAVVLPYRQATYSLRVSRVVIEALINGIPVITTAGTTLSDQVSRFGSGLEVSDGNPDSLVDAMREMEGSYSFYADKAWRTRQQAATHFSVGTFRKTAAILVCLDKDRHVVAACKMGD
jgi:glycosyltransferase involved in cell wall biosynthesis